MSSNRPAMPGDALVTYRERVVGPLLLPTVQRDQFIEEFNRTYQSIGLCIRITPTGDQIFRRESDGL